MCRLSAYIGSPIVAADLVTRPNHSIMRQSFAARERLCELHSVPSCINGDGFGLGWYANDIENDVEPCIYRSTRPAWNDENLTQLSEKICSRVVFAHVRAASPGSVVAERLCHPFRCGRYLFMHNGNIGGFDKVRRKLMDRLNDVCFEFAVANGASDTVVCFALFLNLLHDHLEICNPDELRKRVEGVVACITQTCMEAGVEETSLLNFVISDGLMLIATRYVYDPKNPDAQPASLYFGAGTAYERKQGPCTGEYHMAYTDRRMKCVVATSEPLSDNATDWVAVPKNNIVVVTPDLHLLLAPIASSASMSLALENILSMERLLPDELKHSLGKAASRLAVGPSDSPRGSGPVYRARHVIMGHSDSALALAVSDCSLLSGSQDGSIRVWNIESFTVDRVIQCADEGCSVLAMVAHGNLLYTTSSDNKLRAWDLASGQFNLLGEAYAEGMGHPLALALSNDGHVFVGFQDTSLRRTSAADLASGAINGSFHPERLGVGDVASHHCGPVTALVSYDKYIVSGAGDGLVKVWLIEGKLCIRTLQGHHGSVLTLVAGQGVVISGSRDTTVKVWDMDSLACKRTLRGHNDDVLSLALGGGFLFSGSADGKIVAWRLDTLTPYRSFKDAEHGIQSLVTTPSGLLFSGLNGGQVLAWDMPQQVVDSAHQSHPRRPWAERSNSCGCLVSLNQDGEAVHSPSRNTPTKLSGDLTSPYTNGTTSSTEELNGSNGVVSEEDELLTMEECLREFVSYQSVSVSDADFHKEECWRCAKFLSSLLERLGAAVKMVGLIEGRSPVVLARFGSDPSKPTVTFYGHYDVVPATEMTWRSEPFTMTAVNGYLYGRGITDNKGPIMAMIFALKELYEAGTLEINAVLLIEGEEETSSEGFRETVLQNLHWFRGTSLILQANSTWIGDDRPCLTYGMRGAIHLDVRVHGAKRNLHSGIDGGAVVEPLNDLLGVLATLVDSRGMVLVPGFYSDVEEPDDEELAHFDEINLNIDGYKGALGVRGLTCTSAREVLSSRWRQPTLSITQVETSNHTDSYSIIPKGAVAKVSVRTVPGQQPERIVDLIRAHIKHEFGKRRSPNELFIDVKKMGDWWLGDRSCDAFQVAENAITEVWGQRPLYVREGGTMPITAFLEHLFKAPAIHLPLGQSTDNAHLPNERIRYLNLTNGKEVMKHILVNLSRRAATPAPPLSPQRFPPTPRMTPDSTSASIFRPPTDPHPHAHPPPRDPTHTRTSSNISTISVPGSVCGGVGGGNVGNGTVTINMQRPFSPSTVGSPQSLSLENYMASLSIGGYRQQEAMGLLGDASMWHQHSEQAAAGKRNRSSSQPYVHPVLHHQSHSMPPSRSTTSTPTPRNTARTGFFDEDDETRP